VVTADPMFTHADVCQAVVDRDGDYVVYAKGNQATLQADLAATFTAADAGAFPPGGAGRVGRRCADREHVGEGARAA
jgi:hypothetical protein